jgi:hypothetical protein
MSTEHQEAVAPTPVARPLDAFHVTDARSASWVARKVNEARAHQVRVKRWAERELKRAQRREQSLLVRFGPELERWTRDELARVKGKRKSVALPGGTLGFRAGRPKLVVTDEDRARVWCRIHLPHALRTVESVSRTELREHVGATGEVADGTDLSTGGEQFYVA